MADQNNLGNVPKSRLGEISDYPVPGELFGKNVVQLAGIRYPDCMRIADSENDLVYYGCDQEWFDDQWQRQAGCGPSTAASMLYYLSSVQDIYRPLYGSRSRLRQDFVSFMAEIWEQVKPGHMGIHQTGMLAEGITGYAGSHNLNLITHELTIPAKSRLRPDFTQFIEFIRQGFEVDCPVAWLNLSNGLLRNIDSWHWVTLTSVWQRKDGEIFAVLSDSGTRKVVSLSLWYRTSRLGGGLVYFVPADQSTVSESLPCEDHAADL